MGYFKLIEHRELARVSETMSFLLRSSQGQNSINYLSIDMQVLLHESHMVKKMIPSHGQTGLRKCTKKNYSAEV